jgi:hypothetical protein
VSTSNIDIVKGDGKFELIAQIVDCARGISWSKREPFMLTLHGSVNTTYPDSGASKKVEIDTEVRTLILGARSEGGDGADWLLHGLILVDPGPDDRASTSILRDFGTFEARYNVRARRGSIKQVDNSD